MVNHGWPEALACTAFNANATYVRVGSDSAALTDQRHALLTAGAPQ
jgi:hypothetical protein